MAMTIISHKAPVFRLYIGSQDLFMSFCLDSYNFEQLCFTTCIKVQMPVYKNTTVIVYCSFFYMYLILKQYFALLEIWQKPLLE